MTIAKVEVDRFSITCSKSFEFVVAALSRPSDNLTSSNFSRR